MSHRRHDAPPDPNQPHRAAYGNQYPNNYADFGSRDAHDADRAAAYRSHGLIPQAGEGGLPGEARNDHAADGRGTGFVRDETSLGWRPNVGRFRGNDYSHCGRGPKGYRRSDERLAEEINDSLMRSHEIDASDIEVRVEGGRVTLDGTVDHRQIKHQVEDLVEAVMGVQEIDNRLRIDRGRLNPSVSPNGTS